jgi:allantoinase
MTTRQQGMDHALYSYSPLPERPALRWPNQAKLAFTIFLYFEYWELDPPESSLRDRRFDELSGYFFPDYRTYSWREYGNRVGIFRILDLLDKHGLKATVAANGEACVRYPFLVEEFSRRGYEFAAHGTHATRMITSKMSEEEERRAIDEAIRTVEQCTGRRPTGWVGQDYGESTRTPALLSQAGIDYVADWPNDDQPYRFDGVNGLVSIPNQSEWDDVQLHWHRRMPMRRYPQIVGEAFETLLAEGEASGRFFGLHVHPWLLGMPHRVHALRDALERIANRPDVWQATASEVAGHFRTTGGSDE